MDAQRLRQIQDLFEAALERSAPERSEFIEASCRGDPELRAAVERYLAAHSSDFPLLDTPVAHVRDIEPSLESTAPLKGHQFGSYRVLRLLGRGGMGEVYLAHDSTLERDVALKFLPPHLSADPSSKARLLVEARAAAAIDHPHVATIHEVGETETGRMFIAMAYYDGQTLTERIADGPLAVADALNIAAQVAAGLEAAHRRGVVHRDVKSANILLTLDRVVKIVDFGVATMADEMTRTGRLVGTIAYMSPEQLQGRDVDRRADLWALGVVLYEMLTGRRPFANADVASTMFSIVNNVPDSLADTLDHVPAGLQAVVDKLLAKDVAERYGDASDLIADLGHLELGDTSGRRASDSRFVLPRNIPTSLTSFVGRTTHIRRVTDLLGCTRLLTLTGSGGSGKTRLALRVADDVAGDFEDGACFVELAPIADPGLVVSTIAATLGILESGEVPIRERLVHILHDVRGLLLLDNFEQVAEAAPLVVDLLATCPGLKILVTSRVPLHVRGEQEFLVPPLTVPEIGSRSSPERLTENEAVTLFAERAKAIRPDFALNDDNAQAVAQVCIQLDGLPLAIELAASRIKVLSPRAILHRLTQRLDLLSDRSRDVSRRHQTLREAIGWSYELLTRDEQQLFRRTAVFVGGHTVEATDAVHGVAEGMEMEVLEGLSSLVDKNLVQQQEQEDGEPRFLRLETIREFSLECLRASGEEAVVRRAHLNFFLKLSEQAEDHLTGPNQEMWLRRLIREQDNLRAALNYAQEHDSQAAFRLGAALWRFWLVSGQLGEGSKRLERILALEGSSTSPARHAKLVTGAGTLAHNMGLYQTAHAFYEESLALHRERDDIQGIADTLNDLGWMAWRLGYYERAWNLSEESLALHRELGQKRGMALALNNMGWVAHHRGDFSNARHLHQKSLGLQRERGDQRGTAFARTNLGWATSKQEDPESALAMLEQAQEVFRTVGDRQLLAFCTTVLAEVLYHLGDTARAGANLEDTSLPIFREIGDRYGLAVALCTHGDVLLGQGRRPEATQRYKESLQLRETMGDRWGTAQTLCRLAAVALAEGERSRADELGQRSLSLRWTLEDQDGIAESLLGIAAACDQSAQTRAARLLGASEALRSSIHATFPPHDERTRAHLVATLPQELGAEAFAAARTQGSSMPLQQSVSYGLNLDDAV